MVSASKKTELEQATVLTLADKAYRAIEGHIVRLEYRPGTPLSEYQLSAELGISRTPVREALRRLAVDRMVEILPRRGAFVSELDFREYFNLLDLRRDVDRYANRRAAERATADERQQMSAMEQRMREVLASGTNDEFVQLDRDYKEVILVACRNPFVETTLRPMFALSRRFWYFHSRQVSLDVVREAISAHIPVMNSIAQGDGKAAVIATEHLFDFLENFSRSALHRAHEL